MIYRWIGNINIACRPAILAGIFIFASFLVAAIGFSSITILRSEFDRLYNFQIVPIDNLEQATIHEKDLDLDVHSLQSSNITAARRTELANAIRYEDQQLSAIMTRYQSEWLSTTSQDFTDVLAREGQSSLQKDETAALQQYQDAYSQYVPVRDAVLSGKPGDAVTLSRPLDQMDAALSRLTDINRRYAVIGTSASQNKFNLLRWQVISAGAWMSLLGTLSTFWLDRRGPGKLLLNE